MTLPYWIGSHLGTCPNIVRYCTVNCIITYKYTWHTIIINLQWIFLMNHKVYVKWRAKLICINSFSMNLLVKINNIITYFCIFLYKLWKLCTLLKQNCSLDWDCRCGTLRKKLYKIFNVNKEWLVNR